MLTGVFHLHEQEARQVMTPIPAVVTIDISQDVETALQLCVSSGHTRLIVTEDEDRDRVRGLVHASTLIRQLMQEGPHAPIEPLVHDAPIVPETKPLDDLLADLQRQRTSLAVVVDEYGRVVGIVTVEDIIEEVVGEITDETDPAAGEVRKLANGDWFVRGHVSVTDLADYGLNLPVDSDVLQLRSAASSSPSSAACPAAATRSTRTGSQSASSPSATIASRPCASANAAPCRPARVESSRTPDGGCALNSSGPRGERAGACALGGGGCAVRLSNVACTSIASLMNAA